MELYRPDLKRRAIGIFKLITVLYCMDSESRVCILPR